MYKDKDQQKAAQRKYYENNKELFKERGRKRKQEIRNWYKNLKSTLKCLRCGENHIECLEFHHVDDSKDDNISNLIACRRSKTRILEEIKKCEVLCANCHRKLHHNIRNNIEETECKIHSKIDQTPGAMITKEEVLSVIRDREIVSMPEILIRIVHEKLGHNLLTEISLKLCEKLDFDVRQKVWELLGDECVNFTSKREIYKT
jgi:transcription elongation factor Elf1